MFDNLSFSDHPVHPPANRGDPWECEFPTSKGYIIKPVDGVFQLYKDQEAADRNEPIYYSYPKMDTFVQDMNLLCTMIADGPL